MVPHHKVKEKYVGKKGDEHDVLYMRLHACDCVVLMYVCEGLSRNLYVREALQG